MGISYSYEIGFGFAIKVGEESRSSKFADWVNEYEDVDDMLVRKYLEENFEHLSYSICGDFISGESYHFFYLDENYFRVDEIYEAPTLVEFDELVLGTSQMGDFVKLKMELNIPDQNSLGWKLFNNVS